MTHMYMAARLIIAAGLLLLPQAVHSQYWTARADGGGTEIMEAADQRAGITAMTGRSIGQDGMSSILTVLLDARGDTLWQRRETMPHDAFGTDIRITSDGGALVAAAWWTPQSWRSMLLRYDADGTVSWRRQVSFGFPSAAQYPRTLELLDDGSSVLLCSGYEGSAASSLLVATGTDGGPLWEAKETGATLVDLCRWNTGVAAVGSISSTGQQDMYAVRYMADGTRDASISLQASADMDDALSMCVSDGGDVFAAGRIPDTGSDVLMTMLRWQSDETTSFHTLHSAYAANRCTDIRLMPGTGIAISARIENMQGGMDALIGMFDFEGNLLWSDTRSGTGDGDDRPPLFGGCAGGNTVGSDALRVDWAPARDVVSMEDEIIYSIYVAATPGAQNFGTPDLRVHGGMHALLGGLIPNTDYYVVVRAEDGTGNQDDNTREVRLTTGTGSLRITTASLPDGTEGINYTVPLQAEGGLPPYRWEFTAGALPPGITLDTAGVLDGTPTLAGTYTFTLTVTDTNDSTDAAEYTIDIAAPELTIVTDSLPDAEVCRPYLTTMQASGGTPPYKWIILGGGFPNGFDLAEDGTLSGETHFPGIHTFIVGVEDANQNTETKQLTLTITPAQRLHVIGDKTLPGGTHCFSTLYVDDGARLAFEGPAMIRCSDSLVVLGEITADCADLTFLDYRVALIHGRIDNRCVTGDSTQGGSLMFFSNVGEFILEQGNPASGLFSHGGLQLTDDTTIAEWRTVVTPDAQSAVPVDPVASLTADVLNDIIAPGESAFISFRCEGADPDGGPVEFSIDFGDGDIRSGLAPEIGPWLDVDKEYMTPGTYLVTLTVEDDEGRSSGATTQIFLGDSLSDGSEALGASIAPDWLLAARQDSVYFTLDEGTGPVTSLASVLWDFGDGNTSANADPAHRYAQAGRYAVSCTAIDDSGNSALTLCSIYIYDPDTNAVRSPGAASRIAAAPQGQRTAVVDAPVHVTRRIVYRGFQHLRVDSNAVITTRNGRPGIPGISGGSGSGLSTYSPGWLIVNGARISAGSGGAGASNAPNRSSGTKGGKGGSLILRGRNVWIGGGTTLAAGDGGDGGDVSVSVPAPGTARAFAKRGGNAGGRVRIQGTNSVNFGGSVTIHTGNGGRGGNATATGGPGQSRCTKGQDGGKALARAGAGGKANKRATIRGNVGGMGNVTLTGGQGGNGGTATANGGRGGDANCETTAVGGLGGWARAFGGDGGNSGHSGASVSGAENFKPGAGGDANASPGDGGNASATPNPAKGKDGCPGEDGGSATATGGRGGDGLAVTGKKGRLIGQGQDADPGTATVNGSNGGIADATGGDGGEGTDCDCDGGNGGTAAAHGGMRGDTEARAKSGGSEVENKGSDGSSAALGGNGGTGGHCCTPPAPVGGDGGAGGNADAFAGPNGATADAMGGDGGDGGDGKGPGKGGPAGTATSHGSGGLEIDGAPGKDGEWCYIFDSWYIYFSSIPDGSIAPGQDYTLGTYTDKDLGTQIGEVDVHFMTDAESGMPAPNGYFKAGPQLFIESGGISFDMTSLKDIVDPTRNWYATEFTLRFQLNATNPGMFSFVGSDNGTTIASQEIFLDPATTNYEVTIAAPQGQSFDDVSIRSDAPVSYDHWEVQIIVFDP